MKLSHSQIQTYLTCSEKWRLHYQKRLRSTWLTSSLFFGNAFDDACSRILLDKKKILSDSDKEFMKLSAEEIFENNLTWVDLNGSDVDVRTHNNIKYFAGDFDETLFQEDLSDFERIAAKVKGKTRLDQAELMIYYDVMHRSLLAKGKILLVGYREWVEENIAEVISIQETVNLPDGSNNVITGFIDFRAIFKDEPGVIYTIDNKTSSTKYTDRTLRESTQLAFYSEFTGDKKVAYVVIDKKLRKREPRVNIYTVRGPAQESAKVSAFAEAEVVLAGVEAGEFVQDFDKCFQYGAVCPYLKLCKYGSKEGLITLPPDNKTLDNNSKT